MIEALLERDDTPRSAPRSASFAQDAFERRAVSRSRALRGDGVRAVAACEARAARVSVGVRHSRGVRRAVGCAARPSVRSTLRQSRQPWSEPPMLDPPAIEADQRGDVDELASRGRRRRIDCAPSAGWRSASTIPIFARDYFAVASDDFEDLGHKLIVAVRRLASRGDPRREGALRGAARRRVGNVRVQRPSVLRSAARARS